MDSRTFDDLVDNDEANDALTYRRAMIGETCKKLPDDIKARHPHLPWRAMATVRNFASHDYFGVDARLVSEAAKSLGPINTMMRECVVCATNRDKRVASRHNRATSDA